jgi:hypothetical protein
MLLCPLKAGRQFSILLTCRWALRGERRRRENGNMHKDSGRWKKRLLFVLFFEDKIRQNIFHTGTHASQQTIYSTAMFAPFRNL